MYQHWEEIRNKFDKIVVALGNFDGVHLGHRRLIGNMVAKAREIGGIPVVFTFYPHPMVILQPSIAPPMLLTQAAKQAMMENLGVGVMIRVNFTHFFSQMEPEEFVVKVLKDALRARWVFVGYNYTFGYKGKGTPELLEQLGKRYGFNVHITPPVTVDGETVSSTLIRQLLDKGDVTRAQKFLGYCPFVEGNVVIGERRGRKLGFPTANLAVEPNIMVPARGVYSVKVEVDGESFLGVANIGVKPTFHVNSNNRTIEVHLLDFYGNLYGKKMKVYFTRRLRGEKKFSSATELVQQIKQDILLARAEQVD